LSAIEGRYAQTEKQLVVGPGVGVSSFGRNPVQSSCVENKLLGSFKETQLNAPKYTRAIEI